MPDALIYAVFVHTSVMHSSKLLQVTNFILSWRESHNGCVRANSFIVGKNSILTSSEMDKVAECSVQN